nr:ATP-binding cassette sub-family A member 17 [Drosophila kikkawai]
MLTIFLTLIWKNFKKQSHHKVIFIMSIFVPMFAAVLPLVSPYLRDPNPDTNPSIRDTSVDFKWFSLIQKINARRERMLRANANFKANVFIPQSRVAYASSSHAGLQKLMDAAMGNLGFAKNQTFGFENCDAMRTNATFEHFIASVCFHNAAGDESKDGLPQVLNFSIIMPSELRNYEGTAIGQKWKQSGPRYFVKNSEIDDDDSTDYLREGFVPLQYHISTEYLRMASKGAKPPAASLYPMSRAEAIVPKFSESSVTAAFIVMVLGFMFPVIILVKLIVEEHELGQCFVLEVNNAGRCLQVVAWFFNACIQLLISSFFLAVLIMYTSNWSSPLELIFALPFFASYSVSVASFIIFLSVIIRSTKLALVLVPIIWFLVPFPFLFTEQLKFEAPYFLYLIATFLMCNVTLSRGLKVLMMDFYDRPSQGPKSDQIITDDNFIIFGFAGLIGIFFLQALFYILMVLVHLAIVKFWEWELLGRYLKTFPRKCRRYWRAKKRRQMNANAMLPKETRVVIDDIEPVLKSNFATDRTKKINIKSERNSENQIRRPAIEFRDVYKRFLKTYVVHRFTLNVFPGEVVVLLGHNSSGKTTLIRMLRGLILPTHGEILMSGVNLVKNNLYFNMKAHRRSGISLASKALFLELTVFDHLLFFSRLRGLKKDEAREEVENIIRSLHMEALQGILVGNLSIGQKRIVQSICAFVGRTKIVLLHKPLDGVDEATATLLFSFVQREKRNRAIFVTSNRSKVASGLGDRIGILEKGHLVFLGTERQLCEDFNDAYRLTIYGKAHCDFDKIWTFLEDYTTTGIEVESKMGDLAVFLINKVDFPGLIRLLDDLPKNMVDLKIDGFRFQECSLDQILIKWFTPEPFNFALQESEPEHLKFRTRYDALKRFLRGILLPMLMTLWLALCIRHHPSNFQSPEGRVFPIADGSGSGGMTFALKGSPFGDDNPLKAAYDKYVTTGGAKEVVADLGEMRHSYEIYEDKRILATAKFKPDEVEALYNNRWGHAAPHSLALVMDSLAVGFVGPDSGINVEMERMPLSTPHPLNMYNVPLLTLCVISFSFCFTWTMPILYMNLSRDRRFNYIELIAGMRLSVLASAIMLYELLVAAFSFVTSQLVILILGYDAVMFNGMFLMYAHVILLVALCVLSINILISLGSTITQNAYLLVLSLHAVGIISYLFVREFPTESARYIYIFMDFYPLFSLMDHMVILVDLSELKWLCRDIQIYETSVHVDKCKTKPNCCLIDDPTKEYYHHRYVVCNYLFIFLTWVLIYFRLRASLPKTTLEHGKYLWDSDADSYNDQQLLHFGQPTDLQKTWLGEKSRVRTLERSLIWQRSIHVGHLSVLFGKFVALNKINFMLDRHQVLSLYGPNGSGKTVLTKSILGFYAANTGHVNSSNRMPYQRYKSQIGNLAGYSAQEVFLMQELTILDVLSLVLRIRHWLKTNQLKEEAKAICKILNLYNYRHNILSTCSQGVLKRLSIALALMTNAELILLDDPFANLDVITQHTVLQSIQAACRHGLCIIYTCADTDFSTPAQRLAAISQSALIAIGERHELTHNYYSSYYVIETKIHLPHIEAMNAMKWDENGLPTDEQDLARQSLETQIYLAIKGFVTRIFPKAIVNSKSVSYPRIWFWLPRQTYSVSQIFKALHGNQNSFYSFTIAQPSVGTLFLQIAPEQV